MEKGKKGAQHEIYHRTECVFRGFEDRGKVAHDMELVTGTLPEIRVVETIDHEEVRSSAARELTIIVATMEHSRWLDAQKNTRRSVERQAGMLWLGFSG